MELHRSCFDANAAGGISLIMEGMNPPLPISQKVRSLGVDLRRCRKHGLGRRLGHSNF